MSAADLAQALLLATGCVVALAGTLGALLARGVYAKLHFVALVSGLGVPLFVAAVVLAEWGTGQAAVALAGGLVVWLTSPVLSHATARAASSRETGDWRPTEQGGQARGGGEERS